MDYQGIITIEAGKRFGKPCIRGLRTPVQNVLEYLASGMTEAEIIADFPELAAEDIRARLVFAADQSGFTPSVATTSGRRCLPGPAQFLRHTAGQSGDLKVA